MTIDELKKKNDIPFNEFGIIGMRGVEGMSKEDIQKIIDGPIKSVEPLLNEHHSKIEIEQVDGTWKSYSRDEYIKLEINKAISKLKELEKIIGIEHHQCGHAIHTLEMLTMLYLK